MREQHRRTRAAEENMEKADSIEAMTEPIMDLIGYRAILSRDVSPCEAATDTHCW